MNRMSDNPSTAQKITVYSSALSRSPISSCLPDRCHLDPQLAPTPLCPSLFLRAKARSLTKYGLNMLLLAFSKFWLIQFVNTLEVKRRMTSMFDPKKIKTTFVRNVLSSEASASTNLSIRRGNPCDDKVLSILPNPDCGTIIDKD